jgi:hypothetical protein
VQSVDRALIVAQGPVGGSLDRNGEGGLFALVAQVGQGGVVIVGPLRQQRQRLRGGRSAVVSCSRPGRTGEVQIGQPSGTVTTYTLPP